MKITIVNVTDPSVAVAVPLPDGGTVRAGETRVWTGIETARWEAVKDEIQAMVDADQITFTVGPDVGSPDNGDRVYKRVLTIGHALLTDDDGSQTIDDTFTFPVGARLLGYALILDETFASAGVDGPAVQTTANDAPFNLEPAQTFKLRVDGAGADSTATFNATPGATRTPAAATFALVNADTDIFTVNGVAQTLIYATADYVDIANATQLELVNVLNRDLRGIRAYISGGRVVVENQIRGTAGTLTRSGGTNAHIAWTNFQAAAGNVANIDAVTGAEVKAIVEAANAGVTVGADGKSITSHSVGLAASVEVRAAGTAAGLGYSTGVQSGTAADNAVVTADIGFTGGANGDLLDDGTDISADATVGRSYGAGSHSVASKMLDIGGLKMRAKVDSNDDLDNLATGSFTAEVVFAVPG